MQNGVEAWTLPEVLGNEKASREIFNISGEKYVTFDGLARACAKAAGFPEPELVHFNPKEYDFGKKKPFPFRDQHFFTSIEKAETLLGWKPEFDLVEGLADSYNLDFGRGTFRKAADLGLQALFDKDYCQVTVKFPDETISKWSDPKSGELEGLSHEFNLCEAVATWEQVRNSTTVLTREYIDALPNGWEDYAWKRINKGIQLPTISPPSSATSSIVLLPFLLLRLHFFTLLWIPLLSYGPMQALTTIPRTTTLRIIITRHLPVPCHLLYFIQMRFSWARTGSPPHNWWLLPCQRQGRKARRQMSNRVSRNQTKRTRAAEVHNLPEKRRSKINEKMNALESLIPGSNKKLIFLYK